ncbi:hypothetical protein NE237_005626 [Protea cynaroides]|uniref:Retrovirus-related Pol polyprotein from transposon TNT 1-94-like beta-barrel domain-containing protein n=1 Tax=Protea cynaroides TaxID=273540 RepID=A0A9Q0KKY3_9MAGN|nr:hypothetical protein NE237_005626 [Protea cynaroides]
MCPNRDWFTTYKAIEGASVLMGNNAVCKIVGIGTIRIKCHDEIVRTLTDVRHIPDLKKNLISLSTLDSIGCSYTGGGGALKVSKGLLVVMKGNNVNNIYVLQGSTMTGFERVMVSLRDDLHVLAGGIFRGRKESCSRLKNFCMARSNRYKRFARFMLGHDMLIRKEYFTYSGLELKEPW